MRREETMSRSNQTAFPSYSFSQRLGSMFGVDTRRAFTTPLFWICLGISFAIPILVLVMTGMMGEGADTLQFTNTWQIIGSEGGNMFASMGSAMDGADAASGAAGMMDMTSMMNINLTYFIITVFLCLFISEDFRSGYAKNLFTVRAKKTEYVISKTAIGCIAGTLFLIAFFLGGIFGGSIAGLSFELGDAGVSGLVMSMLAKIFLTAIFSSIAVLAGVFARSRSWLSICLSLFGGMLLFMMIPMMTPLDSGIVNVGMCLAGGALFAAGIGAGSLAVLKRVSLVG